MHPDYHRRSLKAEIALIELNVPTQFNSRVSVACLPPRDVDPPIGKQCYLSGNFIYTEEYAKLNANFNSAKHVIEERFKCTDIST